MSRPSVDLAIDRIVLDGVVLPTDGATSLPGLIEAELRRILDGGSPRAAGRAELEPVPLADPPDVQSLARVLAQRIADDALGEAWDG